MYKIIIIFVFCLLTFYGQSQLMDVFQNKQYKTSSYVLSAEIKRPYSPSELEIVQDKNTEKPENWVKLEEKLFDRVVQEVKNEVSFFQIQSKAIQYQNKLEESKRIEGQYTRNSMQPKFKSVDIVLLSVMNNCGIYVVNYNFEIYSKVHYEAQRGSIDQYYFVDYKKGTITPFNDTPTLSQQQVLKKLTLEKFNRLYLLQTQKINPKDIDRIDEMAKSQIKNFESKLFYKEAIVYPYLAGIVVEFPELSNSSQLFFNYPFRIFLKGEDVEELLRVYPQFKSAFNQPLFAPSEQAIKQLNNDDNFDISRFSVAPKELQLLKFLDFERNIRRLSINNFYIQDTVIKKQQTKNFYFNKNQQVERMEIIDGMGSLYNEKKYSYDAKNRLVMIDESNIDGNFTLFHYQKNRLDYKDNLEFVIERHYDPAVNLEWSQKHYVYHQNYRYAFDVNLVGEFDPNRYIETRYLEENKYCSAYACLLLDENQNILGVKKKKKAPIDILMNDKNQPVEVFRDRDRHHYAFSYDEKGRIIEYKATSDHTSESKFTYEYHEDENKPLIIKEYKRSYNHVNEREYVYEVEFKTTATR